MPSRPSCSPLAVPAFRRLFAAQAIALMGTGLSTVALALLAYDLAGGDAGMVLGTALALKMVAYVAIAPVVGAIAHRLPRRRSLVGLDVARAALVLCLPWVDALWQLYLVVFVLNACSAAFTPMLQASIPDILADEARYTRALSLARIAYDLENLLSPSLAALALTVWSFDALFAANGAAFLCSAALVLSIRIPPPAASDRPADLRSNLLFGIAGFVKTPRLRGVLALYLALAAAGAMVIVNTVVYVKGVLGLGDSEMAALLIASGAGSIVVAAWLPRLLDRVADRPVMLTGGAVLAAVLAVGALAPGYGPAFAVWFGLGLGGSLIQTPAQRVLRRSCREADRAAFFAANFALSHAVWLPAYIAAGWTGNALGIDGAFLALAAAAAAATLLAGVLWPRGDRLERMHRHREVEHLHPHVHDVHHRHSHQGWEGLEPHVHPHRHPAIIHRHAFAIDLHHPNWPD